MAHVLVVDDSHVERRIVSKILQQNGLHLIEADDGVNALAAVKTTIPSLVTLDVEMPRMDGYEVCRQLKSNVRTQHIPIIMCTSRGPDLDPYFGTDQGADAYLKKPYSRADLLETIKQLLSGNSVNPPTSKPN
ncbi:MAG: response regulator [Leptolyngbyaceae cyanobacterium MO_188.B28]|nr:response regulator [Leptolyngbyaceae cyanobacterium MO_188.B28]